MIVQTLGILAVFALAANAVAQSVTFVPIPLPVITKYRPETDIAPAREPLRQFAVPIYLSAPRRDYYAIGQVSIIGQVDSGATRDSVLSNMAVVARNRGADAILLEPPWEGRYCQAVVIRWGK